MRTAYMVSVAVLSFLVVWGLAYLSVSLSNDVQKQCDFPKVVAFDCEPDFQVPGGAVVNCTDGTQIEVFGQACDKVVQQGGTLTFFCEKNVVRVIRPEKSAMVKQ